MFLLLKLNIFLNSCIGDLGFGSSQQLIQPILKMINESPHIMNEYMYLYLSSYLIIQLKEFIVEMK